jgi:hypothetical protein
VDASSVLRYVSAILEANIIPNTGPDPNPTPLNPVPTLLVYVIAANKTISREHRVHGATLVTIRAGHAGSTACRASDLLFSSEDGPYGVFAALVGQESNSFGLDIYLFGIVDLGLHLACIHSNATKYLKAYEYLESTSCSFAGTPQRLANDNPSNIYLAGSFSSGSIFYGPILKTFLLVYFNGKVDSTFYTLTLKPLSTLQSLWFKGGKYCQGPQVEDVEAVFRYAWPPKQVLYKSPPGPKGFNYARVVLKPRHRLRHGKWLARGRSDRTGAGRW